MDGIITREGVGGLLTTGKVVNGRINVVLAFVFLGGGN